jgi:hypothetical protein
MATKTRGWKGGVNVTITPSSHQFRVWTKLVLASQQFDVRTLHHQMYTSVAQRKSAGTFLKPTLNMKGGVFLFLVPCNKSSPRGDRST